MDKSIWNFIAIFTTVELYFVIGAIAFYYIGSKKSKEEQQQIWIKYWVYFAIVNLLMIVFAWSNTWTYYLVFGIVLLALREFFNVIHRVKSWWTKIGLGLPFLMVVSMPLIFPFWMKDAFELYVAVILFDGFSQSAGEIMKGPKLIPAISPKKTISGFLGSSVILYFTEAILFHQSNALLYSVVIALISLFGDLFASYIKRKAEIKDYSALLPGHGGVLDRFDSFLMVLSVYILVQIFANQTFLFL